MTKTRNECLEHVAATNCLPFSYDTDSTSFVLGEERLPIVPNFRESLHGVLNETEGLNVDQLENYPVVYGNNGLYLLSSILNLRYEDLDETVSIMRKAYAHLTGEQISPGVFNVYPERNGSVSISMLCDTSLHAMADCDLGEQAWPHEVFYYHTNNEDAPEWGATLYVGMGYLATRLSD